MTDTKVQNTAQMILGLGLAALFFFMMAPFIVAIIVGGVIAVVCYPWQKKLSLRIPPSVSSLLINLGVLLGVLLPLVFILISSSHYLLKMVSTFQNSQTTLSVDAILNHPLLQGIIKKIQDWGIGDPEWIKTQGLGLLKTVFEGLSVFLAGVVSGMPGLFLGFTIVLISSYFFLVDGSVFLAFLKRISPLSEERSLILYQTFERSCRAVVVSLLLSALIQGLILWVFMTVTGVPNPILLSLVAMLMAFVPVVGTVPVSAGASLYLFFNGHIGWGIVMSVGAILATISDNIVRPWVLKGASQLHPMLALISAFGAIQLLGPTGIFLGPVIAAVFVAFLKIAFTN